MSYLDKKLRRRADQMTALLTEYQVCASRADFCTQLIWMWGTALVGINAAGVGLLAQVDKYSEGRYALVALLAAAASFLVWWWNLAADRWHVIIRVSYFRLQEIETVLGMEHNKYIFLHDQKLLETGKPDAELQMQLRKVTKYPSTGSVNLKLLRSLLDWGVPMTWTAVVLAEAAAFVTAGRPCLVMLLSTACRSLEGEDYRVIVLLWVMGLVPLFFTILLLRAVVWLKRREAESSVH